MYAPAPALTLGFYPGYTAAWLGYYEPPQVYEREVYISETSLHDMKSKQLVWTGTVKTAAPGDLDKATSRYVDTVTEALKRNHLL